jgi:hypothetical protein
VPAFSTTVCKEAETRTQRKRSGDEDQRRWSEGDEGVIPISWKLISMEGRLAREGDRVRRALSRVHGASREAANEEEPAERRIGAAGRRRKKTNLQEISRSIRGFQGDGEARWQVRVIGDDR